MQIIRDIDSLRASVAGWRGAGDRIALVPTMGALHAGHLSLIAEARRQADRVVASIFVNPTQFGAGEDLDRYPRREAEDGALLAEAGCHLLWAPDVATMYPTGFATSIHVSGVTEGLCGTAQPGHFDGVATVVAKLFGQVRPDLALFGEKDWQQLAVIRRLVSDLDMDIEIRGVPTVREADGLALSSRNAYLDPEERRTAAYLPRILAEVAAAIAGGTPVQQALDDGRTRLAIAGFGPIDYLELCHAETLAPARTTAQPLRLLVAARLGTTRLIDNIPVP